MKRFGFAAGALAVVLVCAAPAGADTKTFPLTGFNRVSAGQGVDVNIVAGADFAITATSTPKGLERLKIGVADGELQIGLKRSRSWWGRNEDISVEVSLPAISGLSVSSGASVSAAGVAADDFTIDASSGASLNVTGTCTSLILDASSGSSVGARGLKCQTAKASASSGASADIFTSESVEADASSGASVEVSGSPPRADTDSSSGGSVTVD